jgi:hypothetical protein
MEGGGSDPWKRGGIRQVALLKAVPDHLAPANVAGFFVATKVRRSFPAGSANPITYLRREYVVAFTDLEVVVIRLKRPPIFRAAIAGTEKTYDRQSVDIEKDGAGLRIDGDTYFPIPFHADEAERLVGVA